VVDGFKPVQRKIMWAAFKRNLKNDSTSAFPMFVLGQQGGDLGQINDSRNSEDTKVAQFAGL